MNESQTRAELIDKRLLRLSIIFGEILKGELNL
jgi:hypothetical protein